MSAEGLRPTVVVALLFSAVVGCHSVPAISQSARADGYTPSPVGPDQSLHPQPAQYPQTTSPAAGGVVPTSAVEPTATPPSPAEPILVSPATGSEDGLDQDDAGFKLSDLSPSSISKKVKEITGLGPDEAAARALFKEGEDLYGEKRFGDAAGKFKAGAARWPDSPLEEDALFKAAESMFFDDDYPKAFDTYGKLLKKYDYSRHLDTVVTRLFAIGRYWEQLDQADPSWPVTPNLTDGSRPTFDTLGNAIKAYDLVRMHDPTGPLADDAIMATANAHFLRGRYEEAAYHYDLIRKEYPKSDHQVEAHLLGMESRMATYQGPMYDGTPLEEAGEIAEQALLQFRGQLGDRRDLVVRTKNLVNEEQAVRDWAVAQYYDKKKCYGAARHYYKSIIEDYPQTAAAKRARSRLEEIKQFPNQPPDYFKWLSNVLPAENE